MGSHTDVGGSPEGNGLPVYLLPRAPTHVVLGRSGDVGDPLGLLRGGETARTVCGFRGRTGDLSRTGGGREHPERYYGEQRPTGLSATASGRSGGACGRTQAGAAGRVDGPGVPGTSEVSRYDEGCPSGTRRVSRGGSLTVGRVGSSVSGTSWKPRSQG